ncbi:MAG: hypothetical protein LUD07_00505 [Clostridiales bacterium]|nr:hypothetical protein [Clostridiales bacterium]
MAKEFQKLTIKDPFMFAAVMSDEETCCWMMCQETGEALNDGSRTILLSTKGTNPQDVPEELVHFLSYVGHSEDPDSSVIRDDFVELLDQRIAAIKRERNWEAKYMQFREMLRDERVAGFTEGRKEAVIELLSELGGIPEDIRSRIMDEEDESVLRKWLRSAAKAESFENFRRNM